VELLDADGRERRIGDGGGVLVGVVLFLTRRPDHKLASETETTMTNETEPEENRRADKPRQFMTRKRLECALAAVAALQALEALTANSPQRSD
jgi:hypothetical protein